MTSGPSRGDRPRRARRPSGRPVRRGITGWSLAGLWAWGAIASLTAASPAESPAIRVVPSGRIALELPADPSLYHVLERARRPDGTWHPVAVRAAAPGSPTVSLQDPSPLLPSRSAFYRVRVLPRIDPGDLDGDGVDDLSEMAATVPGNPLNPAPFLEPADGAVIIPSRQRFEELARRESVPGATDIREVKFLILGVDTDRPRLHFLDTERHQYHYYFARSVLDYPKSLYSFNYETYFRNKGRRNLAGSILAHDHFSLGDGRRGIYTLEFWPTDPVSFEFVDLAFRMVTSAMPFVETLVAYHPAGETQEAIMATEREAFDDSLIQVVSTEQLFGDIEFVAMNPGIAFGVLRVIEPGERVTPRDIGIFRTLPNDLAHPGAMLTEVPQTPLSHVNLKARQNGTPNAYLRGASAHPVVAPLLGRTVRLEISADGFSIREATAAEVDAFLESVRPPEVQFPSRNLSVTVAAALDALTHADADAYGSKAANVAELRRFLPPDMVPDGMALPFSFYEDFMEHNGFHDEARAMIADPGFAANPALRDARLAAFRDRITDGEIPPHVLEALTSVQGSFPPGTSIRCRSSTNNEDLVDFSGAGLYESKTHHPREGHLGKTVREVWAGLWTFRAFEEREFYRIDHFHAAMGVLCHPNFEDERANGVAVTRNIFDPGWRGYYVNVQVGEDLVTNPETESLPDEFLISAIGEFYEYEIQFVRHSNQIPAGETVLTREQSLDLADRLSDVQDHFKPIYGRGDPDFAMEVEFKITSDGRLVIKQARPWID